MGLDWLDIIINFDETLEYVASFTLPCFANVYMLDVRPNFTLPDIIMNHCNLSRQINF